MNQVMTKERFAKFHPYSQTTAQNDSKAMVASAESRTGGYFKRWGL